MSVYTFPIPTEAKLNGLPVPMAIPGFITMSWILKTLNGGSVGLWTDQTICELGGFDWYWYGTQIGKNKPWICKKAPTAADKVQAISENTVQHLFSGILCGMVNAKEMKLDKPCSINNVDPKKIHLLAYVLRHEFGSRALVGIKDGNIEIIPTSHNEPGQPVTGVKPDCVQLEPSTTAPALEPTTSRSDAVVQEEVPAAQNEATEEPVMSVDAHTDEYKIMQGIQSARRAYALALLMNDLGLTDSELQELKLAAETAIGIRKSMSHEVSSASVAQTKEAPIEAAGQSSPEVETSVEAVVDQSQLEGELALRILKNVRQKNEILRLVFYADEVLISDLKRAVADLEKAGWFMFFWLDKREDKWIIKAVNTSLWDVHKIPAPHSGKFEQLTKNGGLQIGTLPGTKIKVVVTKKVVDADPVAA
jgi:hypothetical protein